MNSMKINSMKTDSFPENVSSEDGPRGGTLDEDKPDEKLIQLCLQR